MQYITPSTAETLISSKPQHKHLLSSQMQPSQLKIIKRTVQNVMLLL